MKKLLALLLVLTGDATAQSFSPPRISCAGVSKGYPSSINFSSPCSGTGNISINTGGGGFSAASCSGTDKMTGLTAVGGITCSPDLGGAGGAPPTSTYITQTPDATLSAEQALSLLGTGILKSTTGTGVISTAAPGVDYAPAIPTAVRLLMADGAGGATTYLGSNCAANQYANGLGNSGTPSCQQVDYAQLTGTPAIPASLAAEPFITKVASSNLSNEFALGSLANGLLLNTTTTGVPTIYSGTSCTAGQYMNALDASGVKTCAQVTTAQLSGTVTNAQLASTYSGAGTCTNQFARVLNGNAAPTCAGVAIADHTATGTPSATTFLRGDNTWATPSGGSITLSSTNPWTGINTFTPSGSADTDGIVAIGGTTNGRGVVGLGAGFGNGGAFIGGPGGGNGIRGDGGSTGGDGVAGNGLLYGAGGNFTGGATGYGVIATAGGGATPTKGALILTPQVAPSGPQDGNLWVELTSNVFKARVNGTVRTVWPPAWGDLTGVPALVTLAGNNTWTGTNTYTPSVAGSDAVVGTGNTTGYGGNFTGGNLGVGVRGVGGGGSNAGGTFSGAATNGQGAIGQGAGSGAGVEAASTLGPGVKAFGSGVRGAVNMVPQAAPSTPVNGDCWVETTTNKLKCFINSAVETFVSESGSDKVVRLTADYTNATTTLSNTALTWTSPAVVSRSGFDCVLMVKSSTITTGGQFDVLVATAPTTITYDLDYVITAGTAPSTSGTRGFVTSVASATLLGPAGASLTTYTLWRLKGVIVHTSTASAVTIRGKAGAAGTLTVGSGSYCQYYTL